MSLSSLRRRPGRNLPLTPSRADYGEPVGPRAATLAFLRGFARCYVPSVAALAGLAAN